jgi:hypothetical protein
MAKVVLVEIAKLEINVRYQSFPLRLGQVSGLARF